MLTSKRFHNLYRAHNAIANVLEGRTADGTDTIPYKVSFTDDIPARTAAAHQLRLILCHCHLVLTLEDVTPLTIKFLWHLTRMGKRTKADILSIPIITIIYAIKHSPHIIRGKGSLFSILRRFQQHQAQERAKYWLRLRETVPERRLLWSDGLFTLEEATDPRHLIYDTLALGHCVGSLFDMAALSHHNLTQDHPDAILYLHYWLKIKHGDSRILTLIEADTPRITIDFHPQTRTIISVQGRVSHYGQPYPIPAEVKDPLYAAIKVLPIRKGGSRLLQSLPFPPKQPKSGGQRISRFTCL